VQITTTQHNNSATVDHVKNGPFEGKRIMVLTGNEQRAEKEFPSGSDGQIMTGGHHEGRGGGGSGFTVNGAKRDLHLVIVQSNGSKNRKRRKWPQRTQRNQRTLKKIDFDF
jgi:hypothetical protein